MTCLTWVTAVARTSGPAGVSAPAWMWAGWCATGAGLICVAAGWGHRRHGAARLARCVHELRGALGAIRLGLDLALARGGLPPDRVRALDLQLTRATIALQDLDRSGGPVRAGGAAGTVDGDAAGARDGNAAGAVDIRALARETVAALAPLASRSGIELLADRVPDVSVPGSRARLAQALGNLIQNAIEHGAGPVLVGGRVGEGWVRLEVADHGAGLSRPLRRLCRTGRIPGWAATTGRHGHGLPLAAAVAAAHGGRLLSAPAAQGARLVLELPAPRRPRVDSADSRTG